MTDLEKLMNHQQCADVTMRFFLALDTRDPQAGAECFTGDGQWDRQGNVLAGRAAIRAALEQRPADRATAHVISNLLVDFVDDDHAQVRFHLTAFEGSVPSDGQPPAPRLAGIRQATDSLTRTRDGWRIADKRSRALFRGAA